MANRIGRFPGLIPDGQKIRRIRIDQGITITKLAAQIGRHRESIGAVESVNRPISAVFASQLARALGVKVEDIAKDADDDEQEPAA